MVAPIGWIEGLAYLIVAFFGCFFSL